MKKEREMKEEREMKKERETLNPEPQYQVVTGLLEACWRTGV